MSTTKKISPILQAELIRQLGKIADAFDEQNLPLAWRTIRTMICMLPPKIREECKQDVDAINHAIRKVQYITDVDLYQTRVTRSHEVVKILARKLEPLHQKIMDKLYEGGYLEVTSEVPIGKEIPFV